MKKTKQLVPKRRFKEFENSGEWKQHKLKDVVRFTKGRGYAKRDLTASGTPIILYGRLYTNFETVINKVDTFAKAKENTVYSTGTEVIVPSSGETAEDIARAAAVRKEGVILGGDLNIMHLVESKDPVFLALSISNGNRKKELIKRAQGSSVVHLYNTDLEEAEVLFPKIEEQRKISSFFKHIDNLINLQKNKIEKSKKIKKSYLSDMFPKEGEKYPKKRFQGFSEPWDLVKLSDISNVTGGGTPNTSNPKYWDGDIDWYSPTEIGNEVYAKSSVKKITKLGLEKSSANILPENRTILFTSRAGIGGMAILRNPGATNQGFQSLVLRDDIDTYFIYSMGYLIKEYAEKNASGSTFMEISGKNLEKMPLRIPSSEEQIKIGNFFKNLDKQITIEEQKLEKIEQLKQAYLNELFV